MKIKLYLLTVVLTAAICFAQSERGNISGVVTDSSGSVVPGAPVKVINQGTNGTTNVSTSSSGEFNAPNLDPGTYRVEVAVQGFQTAAIAGLTVAAGSTSRADVQLQVGGVTQTVEVQAQNTLVQTEDAKVSTSVSTLMVESLPVVVGGAMRSAFDLVAAVPEAKNGNNLSLGGGQGGAFSANLDGVSVNTNRDQTASETSSLTPSVEAITEFSVDTNGFKAEYGQAGGGVISFASKSGTNDVHGSLYDYIRNDKLDARGFFAASAGIYKQNDFGGSMGGPVYIPKLYNGKNRTFFFFSYEGFRKRVGNAGVISSVPTPEMFTGDFSKLVNSAGKQLVIYDPATTRANPSGSGYIRDPFPGNVINPVRFSSVAKQYLALAGGKIAPNRPGLTPGTIGYISNNFMSGDGSTAQTTDKLSVKIDQAFSDAHRISYMFNRNNDVGQPGPAGPAGLPVPFNSASKNNQYANFHRVSYDWNLSPHAFSHFTFGINTFHQFGGSVNLDGDWKSKVCLPNTVDCNVNLLRLTFTEFGGWAGNGGQGTEQPRWTYKEDFTYIRGSHSMKAGVTYDHQEANGSGQANIGGLAGFSFAETAVPGSASQAAGGGSSFASFLLGYADSGGTETKRYLLQKYRYWAFYAQDDWRISPKLMLNYGVRYEFTLPPLAGNDQYSDFSPTKPNPAVNNYLGALIFAGSGTGREGRRSLVGTYYAAFSPRVGLAYSLDSKTTIRAGIGRSFGRVVPPHSSSHYAGFIGQYSFTSPDLGITPSYLMDQGLPSYNLPPMIDPTFSNNQNVDYWAGKGYERPSQYDNWTLSVQREMVSHLTAEIDYNASVGSRLNAGLMNINQVPMTAVNALIAKYGATQAVSLLNSKINSAAAVAAGFTAPYAAFTTSAQRSQTVAQALRAYPQYLTIDTSTGGGDKTGHSTYHALVAKMNYRASGGLSLQWNYSFSKVMTNSDNFRTDITGSAITSLDAGNLSLEKSIGSFNQTHNLKLSTVYELPFGKGRRWLSHSVLGQVIGGWRVSAIQSYSSGTPIQVTANATMPIYNGMNRPMVTTYDWLTPISGNSFDPAKDKYLNASAFPAQTLGVLGNAPRYNSKSRLPANLNENISLAKTIALHESVRLDFRAEAFNLFNRVVFGAPVTNLSSATFGTVTSQSNNPRQIQGGLRIYW